MKRTFLLQLKLVAALAAGLTHFFWSCLLNAQMTQSEPVQSIAISATANRPPSPRQPDIQKAQGQTANSGEQTVPKVKPTSPSEFLADRGGKLLVASIIIALVPLLFHAIRHRLRSPRRKRLRSSKTGGRLSSHPGKPFAHAEKVPPRPRAPFDEAAATPPAQKTVLPSPPRVSTSDHLFDTARTSLQLLRQTPDHLKEPVIDQLGRILDALQAEFHRRPHDR